MSTARPPENDASDRPLLDLLRRRGPMTVAQLAEAFGVTPTAVRNRLTRLMGSGLVERKAESAGRGRPHHTYEISAAAQKRLGQNYTDLALALWEEMMRSVDDPRLRRRVFQRVTERLAELYRAQLTGDAWQGRLVQLGHLLHDRGIEAEVVFPEGDAGPILRQYSCPYFELAEADDTVCALERKMFEKVVGQALRLSSCRLDGDRACQFEGKPVVAVSPAAGTPHPSHPEPTRDIA
jgi:predicted ArsR family transcriptional regulator